MTDNEPRSEVHPVALMEEPTPDTEFLLDTLPPEPDGDPPEPDGWVSPLVLGYEQMMRLCDERLPAACDDGMTMEATR